MIINASVRWTTEGHDGDVFPVRGVRLSLREWEDLTLALPLEHIAGPRANIEDFSDFSGNLFKGIVLVVDKGSNNSYNTYAYLTHSAYKEQALELIPCHGNAKTILVPLPQFPIANTQRNEFEERVQEEYDDAEVLSKMEIDFRHVNDNWILQEMGKEEHIVSREI